MWVIDKNFEETSIEYLRSKTSIFKEMGITEIVKDRDKQLKGIDLICNLPLIFPKSFFKLKNRKIDVKSIAKVIPTFSFEISGNRNSGKDGWFINQDLLTDYYLLVYHQIENESASYTKNKQNMRLDNIQYTKAILVKKKKLTEYVHRYFNGRDLTEIVKEIREISDDKKGINRFIVDKEGNLAKKRKDDEKELYITVSNQLKEQPINIIIKRTILEKLAEKIWEVDGNGKPYIS